MLCVTELQVPKSSVAMVESICRALRDGALEGEHAPALTIKDSIASPFGFDFFAHVFSKVSSFILAAKYQSRLVYILAETYFLVLQIYFILFLLNYLQRSRARRVFTKSVVLCGFVEEERSRCCFF